MVDIYLVTVVTKDTQPPWCSLSNGNFDFDDFHLHSMTDALHEQYAHTTRGSKPGKTHDFTKRMKIWNQ